MKVIYAFQLLLRYKLYKQFKNICQRPFKCNYASKITLTCGPRADLLEEIERGAGRTIQHQPRAILITAIVRQASAARHRIVVLISIRAREVDRGGRRRVRALRRGRVKKCCRVRVLNIQMATHRLTHRARAELSVVKKRIFHLRQGRRRPPATTATMIPLIFGWSYWSAVMT